MSVDREVEARPRLGWRVSPAMVRVTLAAVVGAGLGLAVAGALALSGCGGGGGVGAACDAKEGEVLLTELMIDPPGEDGAEEWIEVFNASERDVVLDRARVVVETSRTAEWELHPGAPLAKGSRLLLGGGGAAGASPAAYLSWGKALELANTGAKVSLVCGEAVVDAMSYGAAGGAAIPGVGHTASREDDGERWCAGATEFGEGRFGTPGEANPPCGLRSCSEGGGVRSVVTLAAGEVAVSEVFAGVGDGGDWIELVGVGAREVDLNGVALEITNDATGKLAGRWVIAGAACRRMGPGQYVVLAGAVAPGGPAVDVVVPGLALPAHVGLEVRLVSEERVVDRARVPPLPSDASVRLDQARVGPGGDADRGAYCEAGKDQTGAFVGRGTPGRVNGSCGTFSCIEGGAARAARVPAQGSLVVSEVFARPALGAITGGGRDWLELFVAGAEPVDLNGVTMAIESGDTGAAVEVVLAPESCAVASPGSYVVVAASTDPALAGGVRALVGVPGLALYNEAPLLFTVRHGESVIDVARVPPAVSGRSQSLATSSLDAAANDEPGAFCVSQVTGLFDEAGTPGGTNICGPVCRDGEVRSVRRPRAGDLVLTEVFPDPAGADAGRDWVEVRARADVDLAGVAVAFESPGSRGSWPLRDPRGAGGCMPVAVGGHAVIGGVAAQSLGATATAVFGGSGDALLPSNPAAPGDVTLRLVSEGVVLAEVAYPQLDDPDPARRLVTGRSWSLDEVTEAAGPMPARWCTAATRGEGFAGDAGTPGAANPDACL